MKIADSLAINGPGASLLIVDASGSDPTPEQNNGDGSRVFNINDGISSLRSEVTLVGLTLTGGDVSGGGGAISTSEILSLNDSTISGNSAMTGGGIYSRDFRSGGKLTIVGSIVQNNSASGRGGGIFFHGTDTNVQILGSQILSNIAEASGGGLYFDAFDGRLDVTDSFVSNNRAGRDGGGLIATGATINIDRTSVRDNYATAAAGASRQTPVSQSATARSSTTQRIQGSRRQLFMAAAVSQPAVM